MLGLFSSHVLMKQRIIANTNLRKWRCVACF